MYTRNFSTAAFTAAAALFLASPGTGAVEIGENDFRISDMGPDGDTDYRGTFSRVAYNSVDNQYLVVWGGDDDTPPQVNNEFEAFGQIIDAETGTEITEDFRMTNLGPDGDTSFGLRNIWVAHNSIDNEYLVVWPGDDDLPGLDPAEIEVFAQRLSATGVRIGEPIRLSDMGPDGNTAYGPLTAGVVYNSSANEYFVVWTGDDDTGALVDDEREVFGQRVDAATGAEIGEDIRLSAMGPDGDPDFVVVGVSVAYNSADDEYLVVWNGEDDTPPLVEGEFEIFGQRVDASTGTEIGVDFRISEMGPDGDPDFFAGFVDVAYGATGNEYLVVWASDDDNAPLVTNEKEIFGQRLRADGLRLRSDFRLSNMGPDGDPDFDADQPRVSYNSINDEYLVVWEGDDATGALVDDEQEIFGQRIDAATGASIGDNIRLSDMGPDGDEAFDAHRPSVAYNSVNNEAIVVWYSDDNTAPLVEGELEIFAQRFAGPATLRFASATTTVDEGVAAVDIEVRRIGNTGSTVTVDYAASDGTATDPSDYTAAAGTLTFGLGETSQTFAIAITDDTDDESDETISLILSNGNTLSGEVVLDSTLSGAVLTIVDNDEPAPEPPPAPQPPPVADPPPTPVGGGGGGGSLLWLPLLLALYGLRRRKS